MPFSFQTLSSAFTPVCLLAVVLCNVLILLMIRAGVLDHPVARSSHTRPTPKGGGVGIVGAFLVCSIPATLEATRAVPWPSLFGIMAGVLLLAVVSWVDDVRPFAARYKLAAQCLAAFGAASGVVVSTPHDTFSALLLIALFAFAAVFVTNALNFIDGINGLASGTIAISALALAAVGVASPVMALLACSVFAFLPYNFPKARIFMGDVGSQPIALTLAWAGMSGYGSGKGILVLALLSGVLWDVSFTLIRRARAGDKLAQAHRGHLYQLAVRSGMPMPLVTLTYWGFALWGGMAFAIGRPMVTGLLIVLPQMAWTVYICTRAKARVQDRW